MSPGLTFPDPLEWSIAPVEGTSGCMTLSFKALIEVLMLPLLMWSFLTRLWTPWGSGPSAFCLSFYLQDWAKSLGNSKLEKKYLLKWTEKSGQTQVVNSAKVRCMGIRQKVMDQEVYKMKDHGPKVIVWVRMERRSLRNLRWTCQWQEALNVPSGLEVSVESLEE